MRFDESYSGNVFIRSSMNLDQSQAVLYGMPMDWTVSFRPGSASVRREFVNPP